MPTEIGSLSIEHAIPKSIGGRTTTLTCRSCNSLSGHTLDKHLAAYCRWQETLVGNRTSEAEVTVGGVTLRGDVTFGPSPHIDLSKRANDPRVAEKFPRKICSDIKIEVPLRYQPDSLRMAGLRSAYLIKVASDGLTYLESSDGVKRVRERVVGKGVGFDLNGVVGFASVANAPSRQWFSVDMLADGHFFHYIFIGLPSTASAYMAVLMPGAGTDLESLLEVATTIKSSEDNGSVKFKISGSYRWPPGAPPV